MTSHLDPSGAGVAAVVSCDRPVMSINDEEDEHDRSARRQRQRDAADREMAPLRRVLQGVGHSTAVAFTRIVVMTAGVILGMCCLAPNASADDRGPLYQLVDLAAQRLLTADPVAASKWVNGGSIEDSARANQVLDAVAADARNRGLEEMFVRRMFENQIHATEGVEYTRFGQWKFDPAHAPTTAPNLAETRSAIDGFNRAMVAQVADQRQVLFGGGCAEALMAARASVAAARALEPLYRQALDVATSSYCA